MIPALLIALNVFTSGINFAVGNKIIGSLCLSVAVFILAAELIK